MKSIARDMKTMAKQNRLSQDHLALLLYSSYMARAENMKRLGIIPMQSATHDLTWLTLLFLKDRGYISDISKVRLSHNDTLIALDIMGLIMSGDYLRQQQKELLLRLHKRRMHSNKRLEMIELVEAIETQIDKNDDFIGTFCKHIQRTKNEQTELIWSSFVKNKTVQKMLHMGSTLIQRGPRLHHMET